MYMRSCNFKDDASLDSHELNVSFILFVAREYISCVKELIFPQDLLKLHMFLFSVSLNMFGLFTNNSRHCR
jgi:hypothetical protein